MILIVMIVMISTFDDVALFKADVAKAFRNLPVDPADSIKFGIKWNNQYFLVVMFGWAHGMA